MEKYKDGLEKMRDEEETEGIVIPTQVRWLANSRTSREWRQNGKIAASSEVVVVMGSKVAESLVKKDIKATQVRYRVETYTNVVPDSRCVKKTEATGWARQSRKTGVALRAATIAAWDIVTATGSNRVVLGPRPNGVADGDEEETADVDEGEKAAGESRDVTMPETETSNRTATDTETETETEALAPND